MPVCPDIMGLPFLAGLSGVEAGLFENPNEDIKGAGYLRGCAMSHLGPHKTQDTLANSPRAVLSHLLGPKT